MDKITFFGRVVAVLFALLPFATSRHLFHGAANTKFFLVVAGTLVVAGIAAALLYQGKHSLAVRERPLLWAGLGILAVYWLAAFFGVFPERSFFSDLQRASGVFFLTHCAVLALIAAEFFTPRDWSLLRRTIALSSGLVGLFTLVGAEGFGLSGRIFWANLDISGFTFGNSTFAGAYLFLALLVTLIELGNARAWSRWWYALWGSAAAIFLSPVLFNIGILWGKTPLGEVLSNPVLLLGSARASSAAAMVLVVFYGGYFFVRRYAPNNRFAFPAWIGVFLVGFAAGLVLLFTPGSFVQEQYIEASTGARLLVWQGGFEAFKERPLLGWGPENFEHALQGHFDNRLYQEEFIGEIWFDRAHNVVVDTLVGVGAVGALAHVVVAGMFVWVAYRARRRELIGEPEAVLLCALPVAHFLQLQTGFDTIGSYALLSILGGYGLWLERAMVVAPEPRGYHAHTSTLYHKVAGGALLVLMLASVYFTFGEYNRQAALYQLFVEREAEHRLELIETATARTSAFEVLRFSSLSLIEGALQGLAEGKLTAQGVENTQNQLAIFEEQYYRYLEAQPDYYRAHTALAYVHSIQTVFGEDKMSEARELIERAAPLSPGNLLTPAMEALVELYSGNLQASLAKARQIVELNPDAPFGHEVLEHIEKQVPKFPSISVLRLQNL